MWNRLKQQLRNEKTVQGILIIGLIGMVCIGASSCFQKEDTAEEVQELPTESSVIAAADYCDAMETRLETLLSAVEGVGKCDVMITVTGSSAYLYAQDESRSDSAERIESERNYVLVGGGDSEHALVESVHNPEIQGVVIVCEGGDNSVVKEQVYQVAAAALHLKSSQIYVAKRV